MANNIIQVKRTNVSGRTPNTSSSGNSQYIAAGELALNMSDGILFTSNGSSLIEVGANNTYQNISTNNLTVGNTLYVVANGNVGIGTATPTSLLNILAVNGSGLTITRPGIPNQKIELNMTDFGSHALIGSGSRPFHILNSPGNQITIGASGSNVGINKYGSPIEKLEVVGNIAATNGTNATSIFTYGTYTDSSNYERINLTANSTGHYVLGEEAGTGSARPLFLGANNASIVTVAANGNVGVGTSSPSQKFEISSSVTNNGGENILRISNPASSVSSRVDLVAGNIDNENPYFAIKTRENGNPYAQIERVRISAAGNVGIGNTAPTHKLRVEGTVSIAGNTTPSANLTYDLGSPTLYWNNVYSNSIISNSASFSSNVSVGNTLSVSNNIIVNKNLDITSKNVVGLTNLESTVLTSFHVGDYKGGKFTIMAKRGTDTHMAEVMVTHNVESAFYNEYSVVYSNVSLFSVSADISGSNVRLLATASTPSDIQFQVMENKFAVDLDVYDRAGTLLLDRTGSVIDERRITREVSFGLDFINNSYGLVT